MRGLGGGGGMAGKPVASGTPLRRDAAPTSVDLTGGRRPRCGRCGGWLFVDVVIAPERFYELACINCGGRSYVSQRRVWAARREAMVAGDED
jgi:hypothetical protein